MKINVRIILITFLVVVIVSVSTSIVYYSLTNTILESRNAKNIINSANDFVFLLETSIENAKEDFQKKVYGIESEHSDLDSLDLDIIFSLDNNNKIIINDIKSGKTVNDRFRTIKDFLNDNPNLILNYERIDDSITVFYGIIADEQFLTEVSKKIRAEIALLTDDLPYSFSNSGDNNKYIPNLIQSQSELKFRNNFDISASSAENADFIAVKYEPKNLINDTKKISFLVFSRFSELYYFTDTMKIIIPVVILTGIFLALIFTLFFTAKFRQQISLLTEATTIMKKGNLNHEVPIISKDEIGKLGITFNEMITDIRNKEEAENEFTKIVAVINQKLNSKDLANAVLKKILKFTGLKFGTIYFVKHNKDVSPIANIGFTMNDSSDVERHGIYKTVIENRESLELSFSENYPVIKSTSLVINIKYFLLMPIMFGDEVIGLLELLSENSSVYIPRDFLNRVLEQLSIGLSNSLSFEELSRLVDELKQLNEDYQKQNIQMREQNEELKVLHRKLQDKAEELEKERSKAVELTHVKSQFLASMSHELKTPLNSIIGLSELTEKDTSTLPKTKDRVKIVLRNSKKLLSMINNILEFSKIESGKIDVVKKTFLLTDFVNEVYSNSEILFTEKGLDFVIKLKNKKNLLIQTDRTKLEHIIMNLVSNAIKFTFDGSVTIIVEKSNETGLQFSIQDTGIGISKDDYDKIFDEFKQIESGNTRKYSGAGLGLAICRHYVNMLNGTLTVRSVERRGSDFKVTLPDVIVDEVDYITSESSFIRSNKYDHVSINHGDAGDLSIPAPPVESSDNEKKNHSILIVDDDNDTLFTVGEILRNHDYLVYYSSNGEECLKHLKSSLPDLVLLDIMMPVKDGFETIKIIRNEEKTKDLLVFALTAHAMLDDKHVIEESGFDDLITKPVESTTLQFKIKQALIKKDRKAL
ncbi:MAG: response regulator [Melioribacteraceae bacterium]|nr:response regulator [Melioribacteraceae bacterium]